MPQAERREAKPWACAGLVLREDYWPQSAAYGPVVHRFSDRAWIRVMKDFSALSAELSCRGRT